MSDHLEEEKSMRRSGTPAAPARDAGGAPPDPEEVLASSPFADDVETALRAAPAGRGRPSSTLLLGVAALMAVAFFGGIQAQRHWGDDGSSAIPALGAAQRPGGNLPGGQAGGPMAGGAGDGTTVGTVKLISGTTVYVQTADGSVVPVETSAATTIRLSRAGKVTDLKPGATVTVQGDGDDSGKVTASTITEGSGRTGRPGQGN
ncbi:hypothetical protein SAMN04489712_10984 [Thermomonospora echinospora]|uniref:DUF5666 domain-containing protein n=1 Tax=Thermomonospora echinospora TaxID=1992 RepID=A0A1H6C9Z5_9ACTN|nr:hypothetical protein [Thermomonospora echinospora]SEG69445.1 hypothetical protein SAMN04489712_10984 [Thermomonospora echinospora]